MLAKSKVTGITKFPDGITHLPLTASRDVARVMEYMPYVMIGLFPGLNLFLKNKIINLFLKMMTYHWLFLLHMQ